MPLEKMPSDKMPLDGMTTYKDIRGCHNPANANHSYRNRSGAKTKRNRACHESQLLILTLNKHKLKGAFI